MFLVKLWDTHGSTLTIKQWFDKLVQAGFQLSYPEEDDKRGPYTFPKAEKFEITRLSGSGESDEDIVTDMVIEIDSGLKNMEDLKADVQMYLEKKEELSNDMSFQPGSLTPMVEDKTRASVQQFFNDIEYFLEHYLDRWTTLDPKALREWNDRLEKMRPYQLFASFDQLGRVYLRVAKAFLRNPQQTKRDDWWRALTLINEGLKFVPEASQIRLDLNMLKSEV